MVLFRKTRYQIPILITLIGLILVIRPAIREQAPTIHAQSDDGAAACDTLIQDALAEVANTCLNIGQNELCYGNAQVSATLTDPDNYFFEQPGDIVPIDAIEAVITRSANPDTGEWGIALMDVQADLPSSDDSVRMVMFGGMEATPLNNQLVSDTVTCEVTNSIGENINLRAGAGLSYRVVDVLDNNDSLQVYGQSEDGAWLRSNRGWIASSVATLGDCSSDTLPTFVANEDAYTNSMAAFTLQVNDAAQCEATPPGMLIQVPDGQTANIMVNNVELRIGSTAFVTIVDDEDEDDEDDDDSLIVANVDGNVFTSADGTTQHLFPGSQSTTPLNDDGTPSGGPQGIVPFSGPVEMLPQELLSTTLPTDTSIPDPLSTTTSGTGGSTGTTGVSVPLGEWGACGTCDTCIGPPNQCRVDPSGACVWDAADCGGIGVGPSVSCSAFCGSSASFTMGTGSSFEINYTSGDGAIISGVTTNSGGLSGVSSSDEYGTDTRYVVYFTCDVPTSPGTFSVDVYDSEGRFFQVGFTLTCT